MWLRALQAHYRFFPQQSSPCCRTHQHKSLFVYLTHVLNTQQFIIFGAARVGRRRVSEQRKVHDTFNDQPTRRGGALQLFRVQDKQNAGGVELALTCVQINSSSEKLPNKKPKFSALGLKTTWNNKFTLIFQPREKNSRCQSAFINQTVQMELIEIIASQCAVIYVVILANANCHPASTKERNDGKSVICLPASHFCAMSLS